MIYSMKKVLLLLAALLPVISVQGKDYTSFVPKADSYPFIVISKAELSLALVDSLGQALSVYPIACSRFYGNKERRGDNKTPEGSFKINELLYSANIPHDFHDGKGPIKGAYGPWFLRLSVPGFNDIGIHGTHLPESIGTRASEGCIRMRNADLLQLKPRVRLGTPVIILPEGEKIPQ